MAAVGIGLWVSHLVFPWSEAERGIGARRAASGWVAEPSAGRGADGCACERLEFEASRGQAFECVLIGGTLLFSTFRAEEFQAYRKVEEYQNDHVYIHHLDT